MHKERAKAVLREAGVPVAESRVVSRAEAARGHVLAPPYVIKPPAEGSSVGVYIVREDQEHPPQELNSADWALGEELMVELCLLYTSPSPRDGLLSRMPSS